MYPNKFYASFAFIIDSNAKESIEDEVIDRTGTNWKRKEFSLIKKAGRK